MNESASYVNRGDYIHSPARDANHQDRSPNADTLMSRIVIFLKTGRYGLCYTLLELNRFLSLASLGPYIFSYLRFPFVVRRGDRFGMTSHGSRSVHACLETARLRELRVAENGRIPARPLLRRKPHFRRRSVHEGYVCSHFGDHVSDVRFRGICARRRASGFFGWQQHFCASG